MVSFFKNSVYNEDTGGGWKEIRSISAEISFSASSLNKLTKKKK